MGQDRVQDKGPGWGGRLPSHSVGCEIETGIEFQAGSISIPLLNEQLWAQRHNNTNLAMPSYVIILAKSLLLSAFLCWPSLSSEQGVPALLWNCAKSIHIKIWFHKPSFFIIFL